MAECPMVGKATLLSWRMALSPQRFTDAESSRLEPDEEHFRVDFVPLPGAGIAHRWGKFAEWHPRECSRLSAWAYPRRTVPDEKPSLCLGVADLGTRLGVGRLTGGRRGSQPPLLGTREKMPSSEQMSE